MAASEELPTAQFDGSYPVGRFLVSSGLPSMAWEASTRVHTSGKPFILIEIDHVLFFAFSGSQAVHHFLTQTTNTEFGQGNINTGNDLFKHVKDNNGEPAVVHQGLLYEFLNLMKNTDLQDKVEWSRRKAQGIVFTGHCLGGAMAALATLWMLGIGNPQRKNKNLPFCLTFGCPLLGDERLAQALRREKWCGQFCHAVAKHDILPRVLLAPFQSIHLPLNALLHYIYSCMENNRNLNHHQIFPLSNDQTCSFFATVFRQTQIAANCCTDSSSKSPYKPFGYYLFCSENGAACIESGVAVLQMLYFTLKDVDLRSSTFLEEHIDYGKKVEHNLRNLVCERGQIDAEDPYELGIAMALETVGVQIQNTGAREAVMDAGRIGKRPSVNSAKMYVQSAKIQGARVELEWYKTSCERDGLGYYDSFKTLNKGKDFRANIDRLKISRFWDEFIQMVEMNELPDDFHLRPKWVYGATCYRQLVEPLDIAFYYRSGKHTRHGHYLQSGRDHRYKILEKWLRDSNLSGEKIRRTKLAVLTQDSCFWARLEEAKDWLDSFKEERDPAIIGDLINKIHGFVNHVGKLVEDCDISCDVLLEEGSFMKWWREYTNLPSLHCHAIEIQLMENEMKRLRGKCAE